MAYGTKEFNQKWDEAMADSEPLTEADKREVAKLTGVLIVNFVRAKPVEKEKPKTEITKSGEED